jgi:hypothetical protein
MARTVKGSKPPGYDFWSRRCFGSGCMGFGPAAKYVTKRRERARNRRLERQALAGDDVESRFPGE